MGTGAFLGSLGGLSVGISIGTPYYGGYYAGDEDAYGACYAPRRVWNPYGGVYVIQQVPYAC